VNFGVGSTSGNNDLVNLSTQSLTSWTNVTGTFIAEGTSTYIFWQLGSSTSGQYAYIDEVEIKALGAVALYTQDSISETAWYDKANGNDGAVTGAEVLNPPSVTPLSAMHSTLIKIEPGATAGTNINVTDVSATAMFNPLAITDATNLAKSGTSGSFSLNAGGSEIAMALGRDVVGVLSISIATHDINSSSTTEMYVAPPLTTSGNIVFRLRKRGSSAAVDWTTVMDAGDRCDIIVSYVTAT
jgi:hypothetical protein